MGTDSVTRQMLKKTVQHYWVNIVSNRPGGGGCPTLGDTLIQARETALSNARLKLMRKKYFQTASSKQKPKQERRWIRKEVKENQCAGA
jgi:hypothetical protein